MLWRRAAASAHKARTGLQAPGDAFRKGLGSHIEDRPAVEQLRLAGVGLCQDG